MYAKDTKIKMPTGKNISFAGVFNEEWGGGLLGNSSSPDSSAQCGRLCDFLQNIAKNFIDEGRYFGNSICF